MELVNGVLKGDRKAIAKLITLVENDAPQAKEALSVLHKHAGRAHVIGVTGPPGVGKSCLVDKLIREYRRRGKTVGVVAVDPSSPFTGGALMGNRIRMQEHALDPGVFIRSMASRGSLGGLARSTNNVIKVLDASGKDVVIVETVGIGQTQFDVVKYAHTILVVLMPKMGDEIQAIKAGLQEIADIFVVNKADLDGADATVMILEESLALTAISRGEQAWKTPVVKTVATTGEGVSELVDYIEKHMQHLVRSRDLHRKLVLKSEAEIVEAMIDELEKRVISKAKELKEFKDLVQKTAIGEVDPYSAASEVLSRLVPLKSAS
ncbi:MAG: methylmalonyl Co-A mutase-associated GTPase MeaB [Candidatus Nezhaarchaeales archaeon]